MSDSDEYAERLPTTLPFCLTEKCVLVAWLVSFGILILLSFFIFLPIAITMADTDNECILYAGSNFWGELSVCSYCIASVVIFLCICSLRLTLLIMKMVHFATRVTKRITLWFSIWGVHLVILCLDVALLILLLITSCLISAGLSALCENIANGKRDRCSYVSEVLVHNGKFNVSFYVALTFAEGSAWITFFYWLIVTVVEIVLLWKNGSLVKIIYRITGCKNREGNADRNADR